MPPVIGERDMEKGFCDSKGSVQAACPLEAELLAGRNLFG